MCDFRNSGPGGYLSPREQVRSARERECLGASLPTTWDIEEGSVFTIARDAPLSADRAATQHIRRVKPRETVRIIAVSEKMCKVEAGALKTVGWIPVALHSDWGYTLGRTDSDDEKLRGGKKLSKLQHAAALDDPITVRHMVWHPGWFLRSKLMINGQDSRGKTALHHACENGAFAAAHALLSHKEIRVDIGNDFNRLPLHIIALSPLTGGDAAREQRCTVLVNVLIKEHQTPINAKDNRGRTALHYCALRDRVELAQRLIVLGALALQDNEGKRPDELARSEKLRDLLLERNPSEFETSSTPASDQSAKEVAAASGDTLDEQWENNQDDTSFLGKE